MFEGYLELGGNEILNSARAVGYMNTGACAVNWIVCPPCEGVAEANGDEPYVYSNIADAPWYDVEEEPTHRFLGVHALSVDGLVDSTRTAEVSESITDGGVVGQVRHGTREVRVRALLSARGEDALEAGLGWLKAALDPDFCGQHGTSCGAVDSCFYVACPPTPESVVTRTVVWNDAVENVVTNPSFETAGAASVLAENLATNPSFETAGSVMVLATNQATNPSFEALSGAPVEVRRNLHTSPVIAPWSNVKGTPTTLADGTQIDITSAVTTGDWVALSSANVTGAIGQPFISSVEVEVPVGYPAISLFWQWEQTGPHINGEPVTIAPGEKKRVGTPAGRTLGDANGHRGALRVGTSAIPIGARFILRKMMSEFAQVARPYFDGSTLNAGDWTYAWLGATNASQSIQMGLPVANVSSDTYADAVTSGEWAADRSRSVRVIAKGGSAASRVTVSGHSIMAGKTYTVSATIHVVSPLTGSLDGRSRKIMVQAGAVFLSPQAPNVAGDYRLSVAVTATSGGLLFLYNGSPTAGEEVWWDALMVVEGDYTDPYFDGATPDAAGFDYGWTGAADASTSTKSGMSVAGVPAPTGATASQVPDSPAHGTNILRFTLTTTGAVALGVTDALPTTGTTYTLYGKVRPRSRDQLFTPRIRGAVGTPFTAPKDVWTEFRITVAAGSGSANQTGLLISGVSGHQIGDLIDVDSVVLTAGGWTGPYFDGSSPDGVFTFDWTGTPNASTSTLTATDVADATLPIAGTVARWQDTEVPVLGSKIARFQTLLSGNLYFPVAAYGHATGTTYTVVGKVRPKNRDTTLAVSVRDAKSATFVAPMGVWTEFHATIVAGAGAANQTGLYAVSGATQPGDVIDVDTVLMVIGDYGGIYFDGDTPDNPEGADNTLPEGTVLDRYTWVGTPHASSSTWELGQIASAPDPVAYEERVNALQRSMHNVTCTSGPLIEEKLHREDTWGYIVEFTLVAGTPWLFGITKPVVIPPSLPVIVQDVPFNLMPHPSAELSSGTVIVATNLATNPSVEVNATGWTTVTDGAKITGAQVALSRSNELASAGGFSAKVLFTATGTDTAGFFGAAQEVALPGITAATRYSVNLWAVASVQSGTAVVGSIEYYVSWMNAASAVLRADLLGTLPASGGAVSMKSILPPAGTTKASVYARINVTSWSAGALIRLYADALAVTVP